MHANRPETQAVLAAHMEAMDAMICLLGTSGVQVPAHAAPCHVAGRPCWLWRLLEKIQIASCFEASSWIFQHGHSSTGPMAKDMQHIMQFTVAGEIGLH